MPRGTVTPEAAALRDRLTDQLFNMAARAGIDDNELAKRMGVLKSTINDYRTGRSKPRAIATLQRVVTELAVEVATSPRSVPQQPTPVPQQPTPVAPAPTAHRHWHPRTKARKMRLVNILRSEMARLNITPIEAMRLSGVSEKNSAVYAWLNGVALPHNSSIIPMIEKLKAIATPPTSQPTPQPPKLPAPPKPNGPIPTAPGQERPQVVTGLIKAISKLKLDDQVALLQMLEG